MLARRSIIALSFLFACGGTAVIDPPGGSGGTGGTGASGGSGGTTSQGGSTTVSSGCDCTDDSDCEQFTDECSSASCNDCSCVFETFPDGTPCDFGICDGGICQEGSTGVEEVCAFTCELLESCEPSPDCFSGCIAELNDCTQQEFAVIVECNEDWLFVCDVNAWVDCVFSNATCLGN